MASLIVVNPIIFSHFWKSARAAGKTTTIKMLTGLTTPSEGTARVAGFDIMDDIVEV